MRVLLLVSLLAGTAFAAPPPVTKVTFHPDGAIVTRAAKGPCVSGTASVRFAELPPSLFHGHHLGYHGDCNRSSQGNRDGRSSFGRATQDARVAEHHLL